MLTHLFVRDFAIIQRLELALESGLTVATGETGAGKSILIDALALALGGRADAGVIRRGAARTEIAAGFIVDARDDAGRWLREHDLFDDQECVLRRVIEAERPSRGFINGRPVPIQMLRDLGESLVDIHGQHEHQSLLKRDVQRQILDEHGGLVETAERLAARHRDFQDLERRRAALTQQSADRDARLEWLRHQVQELDALALGSEEVPRLAEEHARLAHGAELLEGLQEAAGAIHGDDPPGSRALLARALARLEALSHYDPRLGEITGLLNEASIQIDEAATRLHHYRDRFELDPRELERLDQRLATVHDLARKHKVRAEDLPQVHERLRAELDDVAHADAHLEALAAQTARARSDCLDLAHEMSRGRARAAQQLDTAVSLQMQELGMGNGRFHVELTPLADNTFDAHGLERVEFLVSANPGEPVKPLIKVASGGELSRICLALQVVAAGTARVPTLIFDEVDVGIGGRVAEIVGNHLRALGRTRQVLCITHLAQVAAQGARHLQVSKHTTSGTAQIDVCPLEAAERIREIARMIGGVEISKHTLAHAKDMLARASV